MGSIVKIICSSCHEEWDCKVGCGLLHGKLENAAEAYPEEIRKNILTYAAQTQFPQFDFSYQTALCEECLDIVSVPVMRLSQINMKYIGSCEACGKTVKLIEDVRQLNCPKCKGILKTENAGQWD